MPTLTTIPLAKIQAVQSSVETLTAAWEEFKDAEGAKETRRAYKLLAKAQARLAPKINTLEPLVERLEDPVDPIEEDD